MTILRCRRYFVLATVLLIVLACIAGYYVGYQRGAVTTASVITGRDILLARTVLEQIAKKNIAAAQTSLDYMVDSMFMELYAYQNSIYSVDDKNEVNSILRQTANYRMEHSSKWVGPPEFSQKLQNVVRQMSLPERAQ